MTTDIGSPEQTEVSKVKWKLAFAANPEEMQKQRKRKNYEMCPRRHSCTGTTPISEQPLSEPSTQQGHVHIIKDNEEETCEQSKKQRRSTSFSATSKGPLNGTSNNIVTTVSPQGIRNRSPVFERRHSCLASLPCQHHFDVFDENI